MITQVLLFQSQHEVAQALHKLEANGFTKDRLSILVKDLEHSKLLNAETSIHIDLLSEIALANAHGDNDNENIFITPFFVSQASMQIPMSGMPGVIVGESNEQRGMEALLAYGLNESVASACLQALRHGQFILCVSDYEAENSLFDSLYMSFSDNTDWIPETNAVQILNNL
ncbi:hypothetical protein [Paenibacillus endoradicis]|uniref:hypothetical protein n=1 Tax=Paenibacillus endoradicis TaxID=2972487 RepID=UPI002159147E|nr:hypothetical protein [Paenibacillus endoradicis]MCR8657314.1 hypothetical protein [Paenibacillus endoradicis]